MGGKDVTLTSLDEVVAVRPTDQAREENRSATALTKLFGTRAIDTARGGRVGLHLPAHDRAAFQASGLVFVQPTAPLEQAAQATRASVTDADAVHAVFLDRGGNAQVVTDLFTVKLDPEMSLAQAQQRVMDDGLTIVRRITFATNTFEVRAVDERPLIELVAELQAKPYYVYVEPSFLGVYTGRFTPNDPEYPKQWQHRNTGAGGGLTGADIRSQDAWDLTRGASAIRPMRIAVIDNGMQVTHPDLQPGITGGGYFDVEDSGSTSFIPYVAGAAGFPPGPHGTFCMGMAGARMNNSKGVCGSAPEADLIAIACLKDQVGTQTTLARAVAFAADPSGENPALTAADGADVIACSLGPNGADWDLTSVLDEAIRFATGVGGRGGLGTPIFWAVSNGHFEVGRDQVSSHPSVIGVGRSNRNDLADGSAYGPELAFLAPGASVYSTKYGSIYGSSTGTSFAAPLAAGVGALVLSRFSDLTAQQVRERMQNTADKVGGVTYDAAGHHQEYGYGRINAARAVQNP
jgi:thermitase